MFPSNINAPYSGPTGTDFSEPGRSRAKRSDPCVRESEQEGLKQHTDAHLVPNTQPGLSGEPEGGRKDCEEEKKGSLEEGLTSSVAYFEQSSGLTGLSDFQGVRSDKSHKNHTKMKQHY